MRFQNLLRHVGQWLSRAGGSHPTSQEQLSKTLGYEFTDPALLRQALKHRSYVYSVDETSIDSNERLEFLGDAVLDLLVTEHLYQEFAAKREGELTQIKSLLVSKAVLAQKGRELGLGSYLFLSKEEDLSGGRDRTSIIGDAFESVLGAIYLDGGLKGAKRFVRTHLLAHVDDIVASGQYLNFKSALLEHAQSEGHGHPRYLVSAEEGPDHHKVFTVEVLIGDARTGLGKGRSKKEAQQMAAKEALKKLGVP